MFGLSDVYLSGTTFIFYWIEYQLKNLSLIVSVVPLLHRPIFKFFGNSPLHSKNFHLLFCCNYVSVVKAVLLSDSMAKNASIKGVTTQPFPGHTIREITNSDDFPDHIIHRSDRIFMLMGTVNLLNIADDAIYDPYRFVNSVKHIMNNKQDREFCDRLMLQRNLRISIDFFNKWFSHHVVTNMLNQYKNLWKKIRDANPSILLIAASLIPIPKYYSFLDHTVISINKEVRKIFTSKPDHIYIPISSAFLTNPDQDIKYDLFEERLIHLSAAGIKVVERRLSQFMSNKEVVKKLKSQIKRGKHSF